MAEKIKIVYKGGSGEIVEKKSRFIATIMPANTVEEANEIIENIKKRYFDAKHNCFAYIVGNNNEMQKCSDDGEPSRTAGKPILDVLIGEKIHNVVAIVTRYFGGTLLGTGGLVRAYSKATKEGLLDALIIQKILATKYCIKSDYNGLGKIEYIANELNVNIINIEYEENVNIYLLLTKENEEEFCKKVLEKTAAKVEIIKLEECSYAIVDKKTVLFYNKV